MYVVTGGASGLGSATAITIVAAGGLVVLADVNPVAGAKAEAALAGHAKFVQTDVTNESSAAEAFSVAKSMGTVVGLVTPADEVLGKDGVQKLDSFTRAVNINLIGTFNMVRLAAQAISESEPDERRTRSESARS